MILCIETTTQNCSVALVSDGKVLTSARERSEQYVHAEKLHPLIDTCLNEARASWKDVRAIAVSSGPGSYTGLRIGVAAAKGLAFALQIPLISVDTLQMLGVFGLQNSQAEIAIAMIDARRMEVYASVVTAADSSPARAVIVDDAFFAPFNAKNIVLIGDGALKCAQLAGEGALIMSDCPDAIMMAEMATDCWNRSSFVDLAYYEPHYLKEYVVGVSTKSIF
jgi:tRNA threonylcarbamoyladenosine biosynthesis protein TsaB